MCYNAIKRSLIFKHCISAHTGRHTSSPVLTVVIVLSLHLHSSEAVMQSS